MKIQVSGRVEYSPDYTVRGDSVWDDPLSVQVWLGDVRKLVAEVAKELEQATASDAQIGISVRVDQNVRTAYVVGESEL